MLCDDSGMGSRAEEERCKHGEIAAWCGESECFSARSGLPVRVWRTRRGSAYHRQPTCEALSDGQRLAGYLGATTHEPTCVPLSVAMSAGLGECYHCFPEKVPPDAKPCEVHISGEWRPGFLIRWRRDNDGRWQGLTNYRERHGRRVAWLSQDVLRTPKDK